MTATPNRLARPILPIPEAFWQWAVDIERGHPTDADGNVLRDQYGQPIERWAATVSGVRCAIVAASPGERMLYGQPGQEITHRVYFPRYRHGPALDHLPDVRPGDRLKVSVARPGGEARYLAVLSAGDIELAGLVLECQCRELPPGDQRGYQR